jgi:KDO2-lipid IV(A) lauroyltransferase
MVARHAARLGVDPGGVPAHVRRVFAAYGRYWAEAFWVRPRRRSEIERTTRVDGIEHLANAHAAGNGVVVALPHLGNWEFAGPIAARIDMELVAVAENLANTRIRDWFVGLRNAMGIEVVLATGGSAVIRELDAWLRRGAGVALLCDRDLGGRGIPVQFFGEETTLPAGPVALAHRTGAPLLGAAAYFEPAGRHRVVITPEIAFDRTLDRSEALAVGTQSVAVALESLIRQAPEQWHLLQPNWPSDHR